MEFLISSPKPSFRFVGRVILSEPRGWARLDFEGLCLRFMNSTLESSFKFVEMGHPLRTERVGKVGICGFWFEVSKI